MATKTFEELKQLAIQIRDEKTNKQNTATRIGTQMLEHLEKLEQDYYDKTTINNRTSEYNVSINHPTSGISGGNKYDLASAIGQVPAELRTAGLTVSFLNESGDTEKWEFSGGSWAVGGFEQVGAERLVVLSSRTDKVYYHSLFAEDDTKSSNKKSANKAIKELYLTPDVAAKETVSLGNIRRNYTSSSGEGYWNVYLYDSSKEEITAVATFESINKKNSLELLKSPQGCYCLIDWSEIEDGTQLIGSTSDEYNLNIPYVSDINNFPIIKNYLALQQSNGNVNNLFEVVSDIEPKAYKNLYHSIYTGSNSNIIKANKAIKELWLCEYVASVNTVSLGLIRKNYGESHQWAIALYDNSNQEEVITAESFVSTNNTHINEKAGIELIKGNKGSYILIDWSEYEDGSWINSRSTEYQLNIPYVSDINNFPVIKLSTKQAIVLEDEYIKRLNVAAISWVDDDFNLTSVPKIKAICDEIGCKIDFGLVPKYTQGTGDYPTDSVYSLSEEQLELIKQYELEGFHMQIHPVHRGWYESASAGTYQGRSWTEQSLVKTIRVFRENNILNDSCIIYPGSSPDFPDTVDMVKDWLEFGVTAGGKYNEGICDKYKLLRYFINISASQTKTQIKAVIDEAVAKGAWLILGTHGHQFNDSGTIDETTPSLANLKEIIEYANAKTSIKPVGEVFRARKPMLDLFYV